MEGESSNGSMWLISKGMQINVSPGCLKPPCPRCSSGDDHDLFCSRHPDLPCQNYARLAVSLYKESGEHDLDGYAVESGLGSSRALSEVPGFDMAGVLDFCHVCFIACNHQNHKLVCFAELVDFGYGDGFVLNSLSIANCGEPGSLTHGCGFCPNNRPHPPCDAYVAGRQAIDFCSQFEMVRAFQNKEALSRHFMFVLCSPNQPPRSLSGFTPALSDDEYSAIALSQINEQEGTDHELVETMYAHCEMVTWYVESMWCHVGFSAKPRNRDRNRDTPLCHFFAELNDPGENKGFSLKVYHRFNPRARGAGRGCGICPKDYPHPSKHYRHTVGDLYGMFFDS